MTAIAFDRVCDVMDSDNIDVVYYSIEKKIMQVRFGNTSQYRYHGVEIGDFARIVGAESVGSTFNKWKNSPAAMRFERV